MTSNASAGGTRIGIDVGGTNTDAVLLDGGAVLASAKRPTSTDVNSGIEAALSAVNEHHRFIGDSVGAVMIGTTQFINALVARQDLAPTAAVRLGLPATASLPPFTAWPDRLVQAVRGRAYLAHGGHEFDGREISPIDADELKRHAADIAAHGIRSVAISSVFSPINDELEHRAQEILTAELGGDVAISLSSEIGRIGLLERENATIINAALRELAAKIGDGLTAALTSAGIGAPLYLSQNDGTLMSIDYALRYPVSTFASGPTNSMRGAAVLSGFETCAVVDVGGTTTDVGVLDYGFPREAVGEVEVAGVRTNFRMPDVLSIGLGGGSVLHADGDAVGPDSVGYRLTSEALVFGGHTLTATDLAVAAGRVQIGDASLLTGVPRPAATRALERIAQRVSDTVERMRTSAAALPVVAVGGGSILLPDELPGLGAITRPDHYAVANAIGAAIAQVSGEVDKLYDLASRSRQSAIDDARQEATDKAVAAGANPSSVEIVDFEELPIPYLPGNATRVRAKAVGDLTLTAASLRTEADDE
jgi:N-methylhydantoinase A/oxoprolinase/acetone carboxylase beta subunit